MPYPEWSKSPGTRQQDSLARVADKKKLARIRASMNRKLNAHLN